MLLSEPSPTNYDLNFSIFGFHVRTHPAFFIMPILLGRGLIVGDINTGVGWLLLIAIFFVSILVHELGHALAFRYFGIHSRIVMYWMGGWQSPDSSIGAWSPQRRNLLTSRQQIIVSLAGPVFGLLLAALLMGIVYAVGGTIEIVWLSFFPLPWPIFYGTVFEGLDAVFMIFCSGIILNIVLNLFNLVPIYPLDGGQVARQVMMEMDAYNGMKNSVILSIAASIAMALFSLQLGSQFMAIFFGFMAWSNYQSLQQFGGRSW